MDQQAAYWVLVLGLATIALAPVAIQLYRNVQRRRAQYLQFQDDRVAHDESGLDDGLTEYRDKAEGR